VTLLLTCVTQQFSVQASDRRLTWPNGTVAEELANKATLLCNFASFAYTGLSRASRTEPMDELVMRSLSLEKARVPALVENLRRNATRAVHQLPLPGTATEKFVLRRTSIVGAGFVGMRNPQALRLKPTEDELHPFLAVVSNAQGIDEVWRAAADRDFSTHIAYFEPNQPFALHVAGQPLGDRERVELEHGIRVCLARNLLPEAVARLLARMIRTVSARNALVGPNVMCSFVHRSLVGRSTIELRSGAIPIIAGLREEASYFRRVGGREPRWIYSPADAASLVHYGPNVACNGTQMKGMLIGPSHLVSGPGAGSPGGATTRVGPHGNG